MQNPTSGIHHITAIAGDPQRNLDFYAGTLGLRLVKRTVNFDDPGTYHFYYGDRTGRPGTLLTFFPWAGAFRGRSGAGQATVTAFAVPAGSLGYWEDRLEGSQVAGVTRRELFGAPTLRFTDPDGMALELVESRIAGELNVQSGSAVPGAAAIRRFHGTTLTLRGVDATMQVLAEVLGLVPAGEDGAYQRFAPPAGAEGGVVDLLRDPNAVSGSLGAGSVHHVAWRAADGAHQLRLRGEVLGHGIGVTPVVDRQYFQSIYFREPGGVLFEVATDGPGFLIDEPEATLGEALMLPPQYEAERPAIEQVLAPITLPSAKQLPVEA
jgi:glyoxalase family protein